MPAACFGSTLPRLIVLPVFRSARACGRASAILLGATGSTVLAGRTKNRRTTKTPRIASTASCTRRAERGRRSRSTTGLTWMAVRGDEPLKIMQRAGHTDFKTTQIYVREAESVRQGFGVPFPDLPTSLFGAGAEERSHGPGGSKGSNGAERFETTRPTEPRAVAELSAHLGQ